MAGKLVAGKSFRTAVWIVAGTRRASRARLTTPVKRNVPFAWRPCAVAVATPSERYAGASTWASSSGCVRRCSAVSLLVSSFVQGWTLGSESAACTFAFV